MSTIFSKHEKTGSSHVTVVYSTSKSSCQFQFHRQQQICLSIGSEVERKNLTLSKGTQNSINALKKTGMLRCFRRISTVSVSHCSTLPPSSPQSIGPPLKMGMPFWDYWSWLGSMDYLLSLHLCSLSWR